MSVCVANSMGTSSSGQVYLHTINYSCKFFDVYPQSGLCHCPFFLKIAPFSQKSLIDEAVGRTYNNLIVIINEEARNGRIELNYKEIENHEPI
jgi:hypothetical protein